MSSTSWAEMPLFERDTTRRGRSDVPRTLPRTRRWRRSRAWGLVSVVMTYPPNSASEATPKPPPAENAQHFSRRSRPLANLSPHVLAGVADALALVRLRRAHLAHLGRDMSDLLLVDALDDDLRRHRHLQRDPLRRLHHDGVRIADIEPQVRALQRGAVPHALELQALLESLRDALDHVRDQRPRQSV